MQLALGHLSQRQVHMIPHSALKKPNWRLNRDQMLTQTALLIVDLPAFVTTRGGKTNHRVMPRICSYLEMMDDRPIAMYNLLGSFVWDDPVLMRYVARQDMHKSQHAVCCWNVVDSVLQQPLSRRLRLITSFPVTDSPCGHSSPEGHVQDSRELFLARSTEEKQLHRLRIATGLAGTILQHATLATGADLSHLSNNNYLAHHATLLMLEKMHSKTPPNISNASNNDQTNITVMQSTTQHDDHDNDHDHQATTLFGASSSSSSSRATVNQHYLDQLVLQLQLIHNTVARSREDSIEHGSGRSEAQRPAFSESRAQRSASHCEPNDASLYAPTDYKEKQKQRHKQLKEQGNTIVIKKKRKPHEIHHDDCGERLDGLGKDLLFCDGYTDDDDDDAIHDDFDEATSHLHFSDHWLTGSDYHYAVRHYDGLMLFNSMCALEHYWQHMDKRGISVCEIAGGAARCSRILIRHRVKCGRNFDLITGADMTKKTEQDAFMRYRAHSNVQVVIMAPICGPFGGWSYLNRQINYASWQERLEYALRLGSFCGHVALAQYGDKRDWLNEQPTSSDLYTYGPWPLVKQHPRTVVARFHQCQTGARTQDGQHIHKPTDLWASDYDLVYYLDGLVCGTLPNMCNGTHVHLHGENASAAQVWPWDMARRISWGVLRLLARRRWQHTLFFPETNADDAWRRCPGCRRRRPRDHHEHTRVEGECRAHDTPTVNYPCPGCMANAPRNDARHTRSTDEADRCRVTMMRQERHDASRLRPVAGARPPAHQRQDPRVEQPPPQPEPQPQPQPHPHEDLDADDRRDDAGARGSNEPMPARDAIPAEFDDDDRQLRDDVGPVVGPAPDLEREAQRPAAPPRTAQRPAADDGEQRPRYGHDVRSRDQRRPIQPHGDEDDDRWGPSDFKTSIRLLNDKNEAVVRKTLRRLHLRWYHATIPQMQRLLNLVGVPSSAMKLIPEIVDTCRICRTWVRAAPTVRTTVRLSTRFNQAVQGDLMFYADETGQTPQDYIILHLIDECIRWTVAEEVANKDATTLLEAITTKWIQQYGAPDMMIWDGETSLSSDEAKVWADRWNIELIIRPKDTEAWIAERHHEILRTQLHKT